MRKQKMITSNWIDEENARATELAKSGNTTNSRAPILVKNTKQPAPLRRIRSIYIQESHGLAFDKLVFEQKITKGNMWEVVERQDFSQQILPSLYRFERMAKVFFYNKFIAKVLIKLLPEMFICNALSGYLMPNLIESKVAVYYKHVLQKRNP